MSENENTNRPVLLMTAGQTLLPLWQPLAETYDICMIHPQTSGLMTDMGIQGAFGIQKYLTAEVQETATNAAYGLAAKLYMPENSASLVSRIHQAFGENVPENFREEQLVTWWPAMVGEHVKQGVLLTEMLEGVRNEKHISGCVMHEDVTPDQRTIVLYCKAHDIPTIHVPHANCMYVGQDWDIHTESISGYIAAAGKHMAEFYVRWGYPEERIAITGIPSLDPWYGQNQPSRSESRRVLGIGDTDFVLIYATSWGQLTSDRGEFDREFEDSLRQVLEATRELGAVLCVKMHPSEMQGQEQIYLSALKDNNVNGFVTRQFNEYVLRAGDVLVAHGPSNICIPAAIEGLPSVYIPTEDFEFSFPGPVRVGASLTHAIRIAQILDREKTWDLFAKHMNDAHGEGNATDRTVEFVRQICQ